MSVRSSINEKEWKSTQINHWWKTKRNSFSLSMKNINTSFYSLTTTNFDKHSHKSFEAKSTPPPTTKDKFNCHCHFHFTFKSIDKQNIFTLSLSFHRQDFAKWEQFSAQWRRKFHWRERNWQSDEALSNEFFHRVQVVSKHRFALL